MLSALVAAIFLLIVAVAFSAAESSDWGHAASRRPPALQAMGSAPGARVAHAGGVQVAHLRQLPALGVDAEVFLRHGVCVLVSYRAKRIGGSRDQEVNADVNLSKEKIYQHILRHFKE